MAGDVVLLVGAESAIVDDSSHARTLTAIGNAARTTAQFKYGVASLTFDGTGDWVEAADSEDFNFGATDFTVEGWFRPVTKTNNQAFFGQWDNGGIASLSSWFLFITGGNLLFRIINTIGSATDIQAAWTPTLGTWYHLAVDRNGLNLRLYINGVVVASSSSYNETVKNSAVKFTIGSIGAGAGFATFNYNGQADEIRITKGHAHYAGAFTPPTAAFPRLSPKPMHHYAQMRRQ